MYGYVHNKSKHELDFQMRMTELPFCQYTKVKLRDKSYQHLDSTAFSKMDMNNFWDIFCDSPRLKKSDTVIEPNPEDLLLFRQAFLLSKSVHRRSNRSKWKEQSGFCPSLLAEQQEDAHLFLGDLFFSKVLDRKLALKVTKKIALEDEEVVVPAEVLNDNTFTGVFRVKDLFCSNGMIFVVPSSLYELPEDSNTTFNEVISHHVEEVFFEMDRDEFTLTDEEWSLIPDRQCTDIVDFTANTVIDSRLQSVEPIASATDPTGINLADQAYYVIMLQNQETD